MANQVFVDIVFRKDKKSNLIKQTEKEAGKSGQVAGKQFGKNFNKRVTAEVRGTNSLFKQMRNNVIGLAAGFAGFRVITGSIRAAFTSMREFTKSIAEVNSILPQNQKLTKESISIFRQFAGQFASSSQNQAKAFYSIVSAGIKTTSKQLQVLKVSNQAAVAGLVDISTASRSLVSSMNAYATSGLTAQEASDSLFVAVREGQTTFGELADFLGNTSAIASSAGVKFNELTGAVAALTKGGIETSKATIALRSIIVSLIKPSDEAKKTAKLLGIEFSTTALRAKGLVGFLKDVADKAKGNSEALGALFGNVRGLSGVMKIIGGDFGDFKRILDATNKSAGATAEAAREIQKSFDFQLSRFTSELQAFGVALLQVAEGPMTTYLKVARSIFKALTPDTRKKSGLEIAREESSRLAIEINKLIPQYKKLKEQQDNGSALADANKEIFKSLKVRFGALKSARARQQSIIREFINAEVEDEKKKEDRKKKLISDARKAALEAAKVGAIKAASDLNIISTKNVRDSLLEKQLILSEGHRAELERLGGSEKERTALMAQEDLIRSELLAQQKMSSDDQKIQMQIEFNERQAQIEVAAEAQRQQIMDASTTKFAGDLIFKSKMLSDFFKNMGINAIQVGKIAKKGLFDTFSKGFSAIGSALAKGENAFDAFAGVVKGVIGDMAGALGDSMIKQGLAISVNPYAGGPSVGGPIIGA
ncbi:MAG: phage tail tape measure protein, partial [Flavobacteriaceae bacterium]|nr:phage tail tape measure protein [Flavobacteriaceae bacterium]